MAYTPTTNFGLKKPPLGDPADIRLENDNMDSIDTVMHQNRLMIAEPFDQTKDYAEGKMVVYEGASYKFITNHTAGNWDATEVEPMPVADGASGSSQVTKTATGNPVEFSDGADAPLVKCATAITGSQDLHGYDKPWAGGAGKNKLDNSQNTAGAIITSSGAESTGQSTTYGHTMFIPVRPNTTYTWSGLGAVIEIASKRGAEYSSNSFSDFVKSIEGASDTSGTFTTSSTTQYVAFNVVIAQTQQQVELGSTATPYEPYSNICPITAYTEGEIEIRGEGNIWDEEWENGSYTNGQKTSDASKIRCKNPISCSPSTTYYFASPSKANMHFLKADGTYISNTGVFEDTTFTTPATARYIVFNMYNAYGNTYANNISINSPSTITGYKAYNGVKHTTTFPSAIYRGSEDVVNGEVTSDMPVIDLGDLTWQASGIAQNCFYSYSLTDYKFTSDTNMIASAYSFEGSTEDGVSELANKPDGSFMVYYREGRNEREIYFKDTRYTSASDFTSAVTGVKLAYELATPTTSSVTPTNLPIKSLSGYNHIESSTGEMEVDYITENYQPLIDIIPDDSGGGKHVYSTDEQVVGTWIDGRDVYETTLSIYYTSHNENLVEYVDELISGFDNTGYIIYSQCFCEFIEGSTRYKSFMRSYEAVEWITNGSRWRINVQLGSATASKIQWIVILRYVKGSLLPS